MSSPTAISLEDYETIAAAVMETERGRWFLAEYARRNRVADTAAVLEALAAVEARLTVGATLTAPSEDAAAAAARVSAAAASARLIHAGLLSSPKQNKVVTRTLEQVRALEGELAAALKALRDPAAPADDADAAEPSRGSRPGARQPTVEPEPIVEVLTTGREDVEDDEDSPAFEKHIPDAPDASESIPRASTEARRETDGGKPCPVLRTDGEDMPLASSDARFEAASAERVAEPALRRDEIRMNGAAHPPPRPSLPKAWTPRLLDDLSEVEKAILFA